MKRMPNHVVIMGRKIKIKYVSRDVLNTMIQNAEGIYDTYTNQIYICKDAPIEIQKYYLYHEITHAMHTFTGIDQTIHESLIEVLCQSNATLIQDILNQVKKLK